MRKRSSDRWWSEYLKWGGASTLFDPRGWDQDNWRRSWHQERVTAEGFYERLCLSSGFWVRSQKYPDMFDTEEFFKIVCREDDQ